MKKRYLVISIMLTVNLILGSCAGVVGFRKIGTAKSTVKASELKDLPPVKFEDFENATLAGAYNYANKAGGASANYMLSNPGEPVHSGQYSAKAIVNTGTDSDWGCGFGASTSYGQGYVDATGRTKISVWIKAPEGMTFYIFCNEASANGADGEFYNSPDQTGSGDWKEYVVPFDEFFRNIYSGNQTGNYEFDPSGIATVGIQVGGNQGKGVLYIDDIYLK